MQTEATSTETTEQPAAAPEAQAATTAAPASAPADGGQQPGTEAASTTAASPEEGEQQEQQRAQHRNKVQDRINELTFKRNQAEREAAHWKLIAESRQAPAAPKASEFDTDEDYQSALLDHRVRAGVNHGLAESAQDMAKKFSQESAAAVAETYNQRVIEAVQRMPDFAEVVGKSSVDISPALQGALMDSEMGPDLVYHLAKNPSEAQRLSDMSETQMYREIGRMEAAMGAKPAPAAPAARTTSAPPPIKPGSAGAAAANTDPSKMDQKAYEAWRKSNGAKYIR